MAFNGLNTRHNELLERLAKLEQALIQIRTKTTIDFAGNTVIAGEIDGLAKENGSRLELLAVAAAYPGTGQFRRFIIGCQAEYSTICIWFVDSPILIACLPKYHFAPETEIDGHGVPKVGYRWDRA